MNSRNLLSAIDSKEIDLEFCRENGITIDNILPIDKYDVLQGFCNMLSAARSPFNFYDGYFLNCGIPHSLCRFDLLRLSADTVVNIELRTESDFLSQDKWQQIEAVLQKRYYYLRFLNKSVSCFCYVSGDGLYKYDRSVDAAVKVEADGLLKALSEQELTLQRDMDTAVMFDMSKYLVSPFHKTDRFARGEFYLTTEQQAVSRDILSKLNQNEAFTYCISADAGTGKTLLVYDIARRLIKTGKRILILHGGELNDAQLRLKIQYGFDICGIKDAAMTLHCAAINDTLYDLVIVDEAQRFAKHLIDLALNQCIANNTPIILNIDPRQHICKNEGVDVYEYINDAYGEISNFKATLTEKIRSSAEIMSFCKNLFNIGADNACDSYDDVTAEYFDEKQAAAVYLKTLEVDGYKTIGITATRDRKDSKNDNLCSLNARSVIGQEFDKVALVMDDIFGYDTQNHLTAAQNQNNTLDPIGALFQTVTRAKNKLKIVVLDNKPLYNSIMKIKYNKM